MDKVPKKQKKAHNLSREELLLLTKEELADRIIQLEIHNINLRNVISKSVSVGSKPEKEKKQRPFDYNKTHFRPVLLHIAYFGWEYQGFVTQEDTAQTIENHLFSALTKTCLVENRESSQYHRCGRTDKGVSAYGQVISIKLRSKHTPDKQGTDELPYCKMLNRLLPRDIRAIGWMPIPDNQPEFSARFDCKRRKYKFYFPRGSLNIQRMSEACKLLIGNHDFRNLCKMDVGNGVTEFRRTVLHADIVAVDSGENPTSMYYLLIEGNAFLWHQIRCTMAILLLIGSGRETKDVITDLLNSLTVPRKPQYQMAIDLPLNLFECNYELGTHWVYDMEELRRVISEMQEDWTYQNIKATMLKDCIQDLERKYSESATRTGDCESPTSERDIINAYANCLTVGVKAREYTPLLKRQTCSSLEERIIHYAKRRKTPEEKNNFNKKTTDFLTKTKK